MPKLLLIAAALPWEAASALGSLVVSRYETRQRARLAHAATKSGWPVAVLTTGVGPVAAAAAVAWGLDRAAPSAVLSIGCGGALDPALAPGDVVVATEIRSSGGAPLCVSPEWRERLERAAERGDLRLHRGALYGSERLLADVAEKRAARASSGALAVEMEAAAIGKAARDAGLPFAAARAILDDAESELRFARDLLTVAGGLRPAALLGALVRGRGQALRELRSLAAARPVCVRALVRLQAELFAAVAKPDSVG